jgi:hypothetical protein
MAKHTGINVDRYAGERLVAALRAADEQQKKDSDVSMSSQEGVSSKTPSNEFLAVGVNQGEFGRAAADPKNPFFNAYVARLQQFPGSQPSPSSSSAA